MTENVKLEIIKIVKVLLWVVTIWYIVIFVLPNFYSKNTKTYEELREIDSLNRKIDYFILKDEMLKKEQEKEPAIRQNNFNQKIKDIKEYYTLTPKEQTIKFNKLFNELNF